MVDRTPQTDELDASRRTHLANERTQLAWWRTGLTAIAVALAVGRVLPELAGGGSRWPYSVIGVAFALYGIGLFAYGTQRARRAERTIGPSPLAGSSDVFLGVLAVARIVLGLATATLIVFE